MLSRDQRRGSIGTLAVLLCVTATFALGPRMTSAQSAHDPIFGTWKLDIQKSRFRGARPRSNTLTIAWTRAGYTLTQRTQLPDGRVLQHVSRCNFRGQLCQVPGGDAFSTLRVNAYEIRGQLFHAGKLVERQTSHLSRDGHTLTLVTEVPGAADAARTVMVYERN